jgi:WD40 repeat protein
MQSYCIPHTGAVSAVCFSPDDRRMATSSYDSILRIWDVEKRKLLVSFDNAGISFAITFSPESTYLAAGPGRTVRIWNCNTRQEIARMDHKGEVTGLAFSPNGRFLATACTDGRARLWIWESERLIEIARTRLTDVSTELRQQIASGNFNSF